MQAYVAFGIAKTSRLSYLRITISKAALYVTFAENWQGELPSSCIL